MENKRTYMTLEQKEKIRRVIKQYKLDEYTLRLKSQPEKKTNKKLEDQQ